MTWSQRQSVWPRNSLHAWLYSAKPLCNCIAMAVRSKSKEWSENTSKFDSRRRVQREQDIIRDKRHGLISRIAYSIAPLQPDLSFFSSASNKTLDCSRLSFRCRSRCRIVAQTSLAKAGIGWITWSKTRSERWQTLQRLTFWHHVNPFPWRCWENLRHRGAHGVVAGGNSTHYLHIPDRACQSVMPDFNSTGQSLCQPCSLLMVDDTHSKL
jgi:hypothetical protein